MKLKFKTALGLAEALGYSGAKTAADVQKFLKSQPDEVEATIDGKELAVKTVTISVSADAGEDVQVVDDTPAMEDAEDGEDMDPSDEIKRLTEQLATKEAQLRIAKRRGTPDGQTKRFGTGEDEMGRMQVKVLGSRLEQKRADYDRRAKSFDEHGNRLTRFSSSRVAELAAASLRLKGARERDYHEKANDIQIIRKALGTNEVANGAALVDAEYIPEMIELLDRYGVARDLLSPINMLNHTAEIPRRIANITATWGSENGATSAQDNPDYDLVRLVAGKLTALVEVSNELFNDSAINIVDDLVDSFTVANATAEDEALINGDGTSTYGGVTGFRNKIGSGSASYVQASGNAWSAITEGDILKAKGKIRKRFRTGTRLAILCSESFADEVIDTVRRANGRGSVAEAADDRIPRVYGLELVTSEAMPSSSASGQICALLGAFSLGAKMGQVRNGMEVAQSEHAKFANDQTVWRSTNRVAMNVHEGDSTTVAGPVIALATT